MTFTINPKTTEVPHCSFPGLYPVIYLTADGGTLCPTCVNAHLAMCADSTDPQWHVTHVMSHMEGAPIECAHCNAGVESAYGDPTV